MDDRIYDITNDKIHGLEAQVRAFHVGTDAEAFRVDWDGGTPGCTAEACPVYDGKRCRAMGCQPGDMCAPVIEAMVYLLTAGGGE